MGTWLYKDFDKNKCIVILKNSSGEKIYVNNQIIYYCEYKFITSPGKEVVYIVVGRVRAFSTEILKFHIMALNKDQAGHDLSVFIKDMTVIRELRATDIPLMINWDWIGEELREKYFLVK